MAKTVNQRNISHDKRVKEYLESLGPYPNDTRELVAKLLHDEWHEGHAKGWADARSVTFRRLSRILTEYDYSETINSVTTTYRLESLTTQDRKTLLKLVKDALT